MEWSPYLLRMQIIQQCNMVTHWPYFVVIWWLLHHWASYFYVLILNFSALRYFIKDNFLSLTKQRIIPTLCPVLWSLLQAEYGGERETRQIWRLPKNTPYSNWWLFFKVFQVCSLIVNYCTCNTCIRYVNILFITTTR